MRITYTRQGLREYIDWETSNPNMVSKIDELIEDIKKNGLLKGVGKPEKLKHYKNPIRFSRHIDKGNRLVYCKNGKDLLIISCKGHYED